MVKVFNHPAYPQYANKYKVSSTGRVVNIKHKRKLGIHFSTESKIAFVRLSADKTTTLSIGLAKLMLLTFRPEGYKKGLIAVHLNGRKQEHKLKNIAWGTRKDQTAISMKDKEYAQRIKFMARKHYGIVIDDQKILAARLGGATGREIASQIGCHEVTVGNSLHRSGFKTIGGRKLITINKKANSIAGIQTSLFPL